LRAGRLSVRQVLVRERTVAVDAHPRAISQMPNVNSNNPPGMADVVERGIRLDGGGRAGEDD
jgi:hypothetical protein